MGEGIHDPTGILNDTDDDSFDGTPRRRDGPTGGEEGVDRVSGGETRRKRSGGKKGKEKDGETRRD